MAGFGETLNQARTHMGVTLKEAEQATRINRHHLSALEEERFTALPPLIYQRGIVRSYASYLKLDPSRLLVMFEEAQGDDGKLPTGSVASNPPISMPSHWTPNFAIIAFTLVLSAIVFAWVYSAFVAPPDTTVAPTEVAPTATPFESDLAVPTNPPTQPPPPPTATSEATATQSADTGSRESEQPTNSRGGDSVRSGDSTTNAGTTPEATTEPEATATQVIDDATMTSISVSATSAIWVTVWADDQVVFDGNLDVGESTGHVAGANFRVYTSRGESTVFTNACGDEYYMGYEQGQATYTLARTEGSCAPVRD